MRTIHSMKIQSVSELTKSIKAILETGFSFVTVVGEISNLKRPYSGHLYFTLKDNEAQLRAVLFKQQQRYLDILPADGLEVICRGRISLYEARGEYQLLVDALESKGAGQLQIAFNNLKAVLSKEGLFDQSAKKSLPLLPSKVSLITSPEGAAIQDFLRVAERRYPGLAIEVFPVRVQGEAAPDDIIEALRFLNRRGGTDVIVLCRGGGSIEDLWAFNEEKVARAIHASEIPVVAAIGHEIDFTISDFVADLRAATPTAAAEAVIPDKRTLLARIQQTNCALGMNLVRTIDRYRYRVETQKRLLGDPSILVANFSLRINELTTDLANSLKNMLEIKRQHLKRQQEFLMEANPGRILKLRKQRIRELLKISQLMIRQKIERSRDGLKKSAALLDAVSPLAILGRGYSITLGGADRRAIKDSHQLTVNEQIEVILDSGAFEAEVTRIKH